MLRLTILYLILVNSLMASHIDIVINSENIDPFKEQGAECIIKLLENNLSCGTMVTTIATEGQFDEVIKAINNQNCNSLITRSMCKQDWLIPTDIYVILMNNASELPTALSELTRDLLWNPDAKFIVVQRYTSNGDNNRIFNELLKHRIYNVLLLSSVDMNSIQIYTYYPFDNNNCGKRFDEIINLGDCNVVSNDTELFVRENSNKYRKCSIVIGIYDVVPYVITSGNTELNVSKNYRHGIEQIILEIFAEHEDVEIEYKYFPGHVTRGVVLANRSSTGIISYLQSGEISLAVGGFILILNRVLIFDYIWGYNYADLKIVTPAATEIVWKKVYREFGIRSWTLIICSFGVMVATTLVILKLTLKKWQDSLSIILKLLDYLLDHSDESLFNKRNLRLLMLCWIWYTYFINSFYKTAYYSLITGHVKEKRDFDTGKLSTFPFDLCLSEVGKSYFLYAYNLTLPHDRKIKKCQSTDGSLDFVAENSEYYTVVTEYAYYLKAPKYIDEDGNLELDSWDILSGTISAMYCTRGFGLRKKFQKHAMHIFESGLLKFRLNMMKVSKRHFTQNNIRYFKNLHFSDFRISYYILLIGSIISCVCFMFERYYLTPSLLTSSRRIASNRILD